eukprot:10950002-Lingulodinium_polyedra.AAC.1
MATGSIAARSPGIAPALIKCSGWPTTPRPARSPRPRRATPAPPWRWAPNGREPAGARRTN